MATNIISDGDRIPIIAGATINPGDFILEGVFFGIAINGGVSGDTISVATGVRCTLAKAAGAVTAGAVVYWDNAAKDVTTTSAGNTKIGICVTAAASGDATIDVLLNEAYG